MSCPRRLQVSTASRVFSTRWKMCGIAVFCWVLAMLDVTETPIWSRAEVDEMASSCRRGRLVQWLGSGLWM